MRPIENQQLLKYAYPNRVCVSLDGKRAAFVLTRPELSANGYTNALWLCEGGKLRECFALENCADYIWADKAHVIFLKKPRNNYTEIWIGNVDTGETEKLAAYRLAIREFAALGNGQLIAIAITDANAPDNWRLTGAEAKAADAACAEENALCQVLDEIPYMKNGISDYLNKKRNSIFILDLESNGCRRITDALFQTENYCIDGDTIYFNGSAYDKKMCLYQEIWSYSLSDGSPRQIYVGHEYNMRALCMWGGELIMLGNTNPNIKLFHSEFYKVDKKTGEISSFCAYDRSIRSYVTGDGAYGKPRLCREYNDSLYFISTIDNASWLMAIDKQGNVTPVIKREGAFCDFDIFDGEIIFTALWDTRPLELYSARLSEPENYSCISAFNAPAIDGRYIAQPIEHRFIFEKWEIYGWVLLPPGYDENKSYPALLNIHGGPNTVYSTAYSHEMQVWAGEGYIVFFCNPVGSEGRGDEFMNIHGNFGGADYRCLMAFTDYILEAYPQIDADRLYVTGGSYGGFMTNWIVTHTDRFAAAATQRSISNWVTTALLCDNGWYNMPPQMQGDIYNGADKLWEQSPLKYIADAVTPTLVLHSDEDYSVPLAEGMQMYSALVANGVDTRMVIFKGENHELSRSGRPQARLRRIDEISRWMAAHVRNAPADRIDVCAAESGTEGK